MTLTVPSPFESRVSIPFLPYPHVLARIAAGAFDELAALDLSETPRLLATIRNRERSLADAAEMLREEIFAAIGGCEDAPLRRALLTAKRDLFNGRAPGAAVLATLDRAALPHLAPYSAAAAELRAAELQLEPLFAAEMTDARRRLRALAGREEFQKPLVLSSTVFLEQLCRYLDHDPAAATAKDLDLERALMKYLGRVHAKTSPFSLFCHVAMCVAGETGGPLFAGAVLSEARSNVRINNFLWVGLRSLLTNIPAIAEKTRVRPNPTLTSSPEGFRFLINVHNIESFQQLPPLEALGRIAALAADEPRFLTLVQRVARAELIDGSIDDVRAFVLRLVDFGLLEYHFGVSGTDPEWDRTLLAFLDPIAHCAEAAELADTLRFLSSQAIAFAAAGARERAAVLSLCSDRLRAARTVLRAAAGLGADDEAVSVNLEELTVSALDREIVINDRYLFYEDSALRRPFTIDRAQLAPVLKSLSQVAAAVTFSQVMTGEQQQVRHFFLGKYGADATVPLLRLYEDFYRECRLPEESARHRTRDAGEAVSFPGSDAYRAMLTRHQGAIDRWISVLGERIAHVSADRIDITPADVDEAFLAVPEVCRPDTLSHSAYVQFGYDEGKPLAVMNSFALGCGKSTSRFLQLFDPEFTTSQREANRAAAPHVVAELRDASAHNANLHPPLIDYEIASPGAQTSYPPERQISIADLSVSADDDRLCLTRNSNGQRLEVIDLGFQAVSGRSPLFRLLLWGFNCLKFSNVSTFVRAADLAWSQGQGPAQPGVWVLPRVVYDGRVVLRRRAWMVPAALLPRREPADSDAAYYKRVNDWRERYGIPLHVFASIDREKQRKMRGRAPYDDHKPQFLSFENPFSVALLEKLVGRVKEVVGFTELFPASDGMLEQDGRRHAVELIVQWYGASR